MRTARCCGHAGPRAATPRSKPPWRRRPVNLALLPGPRAKPPPARERPVSPRYAPVDGDRFQGRGLPIAIQEGFSPSEPPEIDLTLAAMGGKVRAACAASRRRIPECDLIRTIPTAEEPGAD